MKVYPRDLPAEWTDLACAELGVAPGELDMQEVLALARYVARDVGVAAVPLTFYLLGIAVGRGIPQADAASRVSTLVERWRGVDWRD